MIRHASLGTASTISLLTFAMIFPRFRTVTVLPISTAMLMQSGLLAAVHAAIALSAVAMGTDKEHRVTFAAQANPLSENYIAMRRHPLSHAELDNGNGFVAL